MRYKLTINLALFACLSGCNPGATINVVEDGADLIVTALPGLWLFDEGSKCIKSVSLAISLGGNLGVQDLGNVDFAPEKSDEEQCKTRVRVSKKALLAGYAPLGSRTYFVHVDGRIFKGSGEIAGTALD